MDNEIKGSLDAITEKLHQMDRVLHEIKKDLKIVKKEVDHIKKWTYSNQNDDIQSNLDKLSNSVAV